MPEDGNQIQYLHKRVKEANSSNSSNSSNKQTGKQANRQTGKQANRQMVVLNGSFSSSDSKLAGKKSFEKQQTGNFRERNLLPFRLRMNLGQFLRIPMELPHPVCSNAHSENTEWAIQIVNCRLSSRRNTSRCRGGMRSITTNCETKRTHRWDRPSVPRREGMWMYCRECTRGRRRRAIGPWCPIGRIDLVRSTVLLPLVSFLHYI